MESSTTSSQLHPLVTQTLVQTNKYFCPFLERGFCRDATRCSFSHDNVKSIKIPTDYCHFYLANQCLYGQECKFRHTEPSRVDHHSTQVSLNNNNIVNLGDTPVESYNRPGLSPSSGRVYMPILRDASINKSVEPILAQADNVCNTSASINNTPPTTGFGFLSLLQFLRNSHQQTKSTSPEPSAPLNSVAQSAINQINSEPSCSQQYNKISSTCSSSSSSSTTLSSSINQLQHHHHTNATTSIASTSSSANPTSYARACRANTSLPDEEPLPEEDPRKELPLCPFALASKCPYPINQCTYVHGLDCDLCGRACLHPYDLDQQLEHREDCLREHEREMELSFAIQRSKDKVCGICMDTVVEKTPITSSRFGILEKCNHIFCLDCIRKWRGTKQFETRTIRACPECRVSSDFVVPSKYWIEDQDDKDKLIHDYKVALKSKPCKYFNEGKGDCPFAGSCFYKHAYANGQLAEEEPPKPRRRVFGARGPTSAVSNYILWNIMTSTDDDDWSNDELESLYYDPDLVTDEENSDDWLL